MGKWDKFKKARQTIHRYTAFPQAPDKEGEKNILRSFKKLLIEIAGLAINHFVSKATNPIKDGEIKDKQLEVMKETAQAAAVIEEREEIENPIEDVSFEEVENEKQKLIEELLEMDKLLRLKYGASIEIVEFEDMSKSTIELIDPDQKSKIQIRDNVDEGIRRYKEGYKKGSSLSLSHGFSEEE